MSEWFVYMLRCADGSFYTGITNDLPRRLKQHNAGTASLYTRGRIPVELAHHEAWKTRGEALKREYAIKRLPRAVKEALIQDEDTSGTESERTGRWHVG